MLPAVILWRGKATTAGEVVATVEAVAIGVEVRVRVAEEDGAAILRSVATMVEMATTCAPCVCPLTVTRIGPKDYCDMLVRIVTTHAAAQAIVTTAELVVRAADKVTVDQDAPIMSVDATITCACGNRRRLASFTALIFHHTAKTSCQVRMNAHVRR